MRRTAFTLMELLVVISIIMILMGMVFVGVRIAREAAAKAKTSSAMAQVQADLANYKQVNGRFPENDAAANPSTTPPTQPIDWSGIFAAASGTQMKEVTDPPTIDWDGANRLLIIELRRTGSPLGDATGLVKDGWQQPLHYRPAKFYPYKAGAIFIDGEDPPGRDSYQLWSTGSDKKDQGGLKGSDDMTTWEKR